MLRLLLLVVSAVLLTALPTSTARGTSARLRVAAPGRPVVTDSLVISRI